MPGSQLMDLYPAIDIRDGGAVRLTQGDFDRQTDHGDPIVLARRFADAGATWLHVVDLDAARSGRPVNRATVLAIAAAVEVPVESGGGVRSERDVEELLEGGVARVVMGTAAALSDPTLVRVAADRYPGRVAAALDYNVDAGRGSEVAVRGWEEGSGRSLHELLTSLADVDLAAVVVTAIQRDGTLSGPDLDGLRSVLGATRLPVIASGGVGSTADLAALAALEAREAPRVSASTQGPGRQAESEAEAPRSHRLLGAISGRALVDGTMTVEEGLAACRRYG